MSRKITVHFDREKSTKTTQRYAERGTNHVGKLYIKKATDDDLNNPSHLTVTIEATDDPGPKPG